MLNREVAQKINEQITKELYSAYLYLDMANFYSSAGLEGFENWFFVQAQEERDHALLFRKYLLNSGEDITLAAVDAPDKKYTSFDMPLKETLAHEKLVTASINSIYEVAYKINDYKTMHFLDWFVNEQGEEEKNAEDLIKKFELFAGDGKGLYMLDSELKARVYAPPTLVL